jgi:hypothetical protein
MRETTIPLKSTTSQYTETEAAVALGISVEELRALIRSHIVKNDEELGPNFVATFNASDIVLLRLLAGVGTRTVAPA